MKKVLFLFIFAILSGQNIFAQYGTVDVNLFVGIPQNDFADNLDRVAVGLDFGYAYKAPGSLVGFGLEGGIMTYGIDTRRESFSPNIPEVTVQVRTDYDIFQTHAFLRFEPDNIVFKPYLDALIGFKYLFTQTRIEDNQSFETIASDTNFDDIAFSYGFGFGMKFLVYEKEQNRFYVNLKTRYLFGSEAEYLQPGSITITNGRLNFDASRSSTDLLTIHLGLAVDL